MVERLSPGDDTGGSSDRDDREKNPQPRAPSDDTVVAPDADTDTAAVDLLPDRPAGDGTPSPTGANRGDDSSSSPTGTESTTTGGDATSRSAPGGAGLAPDADAPGISPSGAGPAPTADPAFSSATRGPRGPTVATDADSTGLVPPPSEAGQSGAGQPATGSDDRLPARGIEAGSGPVAGQARDFESEVLAETPGVDDASQVRIVREGDTLRAKFTNRAKRSFAAQRFSERTGFNFDANDVEVTDAGIRLDDEAIDLLEQARQGQLAGSGTLIRENRRLGLSIGGPVFERLPFEDVQGRGGNRLAVGQTPRPDRDPTVRTAGGSIVGAPGTPTDPTDNPVVADTASSDGSGGDGLTGQVSRAAVRNFPALSAIAAQGASAAADTLDKSPRQVATETVARQFPGVTVLAGDLADDGRPTLATDEPVQSPDPPTVESDSKLFTDRQRGRQTGSISEAKFLDNLFGPVDDTLRNLEDTTFDQQTGTEEEFLAGATGDRSPSETAAALAPFAAAEPTPAGEAALIGLAASGALAFANEPSDPLTAGENVERVGRENPARQPELPVQEPQARDSEVPAEEGGARQPEVPAEEPGVTELGIPSDGPFVENVKPTEPDAPIRLGQQGRQRSRNRRKIGPGDIASRRQVERRRKIGDVARRRDLKKEREKRKRQQRKRKQEAERLNVEIDEDGPPRFERRFPTGRGAVVGLEEEAAEAQEPQVTDADSLLDATRTGLPSDVAERSDATDPFAIGVGRQAERVDVRERQGQPTDLTQTDDTTTENRQRQQQQTGEPTTFGEEFEFATPTTTVPTTPGQGFGFPPETRPRTVPTGGQPPGDARLRREFGDEDPDDDELFPERRTDTVSDLVITPPGDPDALVEALDDPGGGGSVDAQGGGFAAEDAIAEDLEAFDEVL